MNQKTIGLIESEGNLKLEEGEAEKIEEALSEKLLLELKESLETFDEHTLDPVVDIAVSRLMQIIVTLATKEEEKEEEEEEEEKPEGEKEVKKSKDWSFNLGVPKED